MRRGIFCSRARVGAFSPELAINNTPRNANIISGGAFIVGDVIIDERERAGAPYLSRGEL